LFNLDSDFFVAILEHLDIAVLITSEARETLFYNKKLYELWEVDEKVISEFTSAHKEVGCQYAAEFLKSPAEFTELVQRVQGTFDETNDVIEFIDGRIFRRHGFGVNDHVHGICRIWLFEDITEKRSAMVDSLTKCLNRNAWDNYVKRRFEDKSLESGYAVAVIDVNNFKAINDDHGHEAGDKILRRLGESLLSVAREKDLVFRVGGDEFCLVVPSKKNIGELIKRRVLSEFISAGIDAAIGVATAPDHAHLLDAFREADIQMLREKKDQKFRLQSSLTNLVYPESTSSITNGDLLTTAFLDLALESHEIFQLYQPIIDINGGIFSVEVLSRWVKDGAMIPPAKFIPIAESCGQIHRLWVKTLSDSLHQYSIWKKKNLPLPILSLNFSAAQVAFAKAYNHSYVNEISSMCEAYNVDPSFLSIELTETVFLEDLPKAKEIFDELALIGVKLSIDDYGTGFSPLSLVKLLPVRSIKIDGSFIRGLPNLDSDISIVSTLISFAVLMNIDIVAECIENVDQYNFIKTQYFESIESNPKSTCNILFQGYLLSKPMYADDLENILSRMS